MSLSSAATAAALVAGAEYYQTGQLNLMHAAGSGIGTYLGLSQVGSRDADKPGKNMLYGAIGSAAVGYVAGVNPIWGAAAGAVGGAVQERCNKKKGMRTGGGGGGQ